jgi:hypothetical protein
VTKRFPAEWYVIQGSVLDAIVHEIYMPLIEDDGSAKRAIKGDRRRDLAQRLSGLLSNAIPEQLR